jgi:hypothetical protein
VKAIATSKIEKLADESVASAVKHIFPQPEIYSLDIADGLKQLLYEKNWDVSFLLQSDAASLAGELGIEEFVVKMIINAAKRKATE